MDDYINKEDALDVFESIMHSLNENRFKLPSGLLTELYGKIHGVGLCRDIIKHAPTIDAVQVVRCKECKYGKVDDSDFPTQYLCEYRGSDWNNGDHFCSYGERKDNEGVNA